MNGKPFSTSAPASTLLVVSSTGSGLQEKSSLGPVKRLTTAQLIPKRLRRMESLTLTPTMRSR